MAGEKRKHPPIPVIVVVLALLIGGGVWWWWSSTHPTTVSAQEQVSGSVEANEYQVAAALSGRITDVKVAEGEEVTKGQELILLDRSTCAWWGGTSRCRAGADRLFEANNSQASTERKRSHRLET